MQEFRFTFGVQYNKRNPHPNRPWAEADGWLAVFAPDRESAEAIAAAIVGRDEKGVLAYSMCYSPEQWQGPTASGRTWDEIYPLGCLAFVRFEEWGA